MNREIKMRFYDGSVMHYPETNYAYQLNWSRTSGWTLWFVWGDDNHPVWEEFGLANKYVPMQFTGLKDKNGVEIYDGDIVVKLGYPYFDKGEPNYISTIEWVFNGWQTVLHCVSKNKKGISDGINDQIEYETETPFEIIGNIYQNPELLTHD